MTERTPADDVLSDHTAEQAALLELLRAADEAALLQPTPAPGWDVRDQVAHLADTEEVAVDTLTGGPRSLNDEVARHPSGEAFTEAGCDRGRAMAPRDVVEWWATASARCREALAAADRSARVPWGLGMGWRAFVTARLMEHWAHGLDIRAGLGEPWGLEADTARIRHVAWICTSALPYAFGVAGVEPPDGHTLRFELDPPPGANDPDPWRFGPEDATDVVRGPAGAWCRRAVQRWDLETAQANGLEGAGPLAELAIAHARAFL